MGEGGGSNLRQHVRCSLHSAAHRHRDVAVARHAHAYASQRGVNRTSDTPRYAEIQIIESITNAHTKVLEMSRTTYMAFRFSRNGRDSGMSCLATPALRAEGGTVELPTGTPMMPPTCRTWCTIRVISVFPPPPRSSCITHYHPPLNLISSGSISA